MKINCIFKIAFLLIISFAASVASAYDAIDYSKTQYWLSLPVTVEKGVDVFYVYPTAWQKVNASDPDICAIDNASMLTGSSLAFNRQATAFAPVGKYFRAILQADRPVRAS